MDYSNLGLTHDFDNEDIENVKNLSRSIESDFVDFFILNNGLECSDGMLLCDGYALQYWSSFYSMFEIHKKQSAEYKFFANYLQICTNSSGHEEFYYIIHGTRHKQVVLIDDSRGIDSEETFYLEGDGVIVLANSFSEFIDKIEHVE